MKVSKGHVESNNLEYVCRHAMKSSPSFLVIQSFLPLRTLSCKRRKRTDVKFSYPPMLLLHAARSLDCDCFFTRAPDGSTNGLVIHIPWSASIHTIQQTSTHFFSLT